MSLDRGDRSRVIVSRASADCRNLPPRDAVRFSAMGLDGVELVMEIEEEFGVRLTQRDLKMMETVGDIVTVIEGRRVPTSASECSAERLKELTIIRQGDRVRRQVPRFYRLRQILCDSLLVDKRVIRPDTDLRRLIPGALRVHVWQDLRAAGFALPPLGWSWSAGIATALGCIAVAAAALAVAAQFATQFEWIVILSTPMLLVGWLTTIFGVRWMGRSGVLPWMRGPIPATGTTPASIVEFHGPRDAPPSNDPACRADGALEGQARVAEQAFAARLRAHLAAPHPELEPMTRLAEVIAAPQRFVTLDALQAEGIPVPELLPTRRGRFIANGAATIAAIITLAMGVAVGYGGDRIGVPRMILWSLSGVLLLVAVIVWGFTWVCIIDSFRMRRLWTLHGEIPAPWETLEQAGIWLAMCEWPADAADPARARIVQRVREIVASVAGVPDAQVTLQSRLGDLLD